MKFSAEKNLNKYFSNSNALLSNFIALIIIYLIGIAWSSFFPGYLGMPTALLYVPALLGCMLCLLGARKINIIFLFFVLLLAFGVVCVALIVQSQTYFNRYITLPVALIICIVVARDDKIINKVCDYLSVFVLVGVFLCLISFLYAFLGGEPSFSFLNPDGRENFFYLSSFSNTVLGNVIRPGFIYDEPGAFSFLLCFVVMVRELLNRKKFISWIILIGGLITLSVAHLVILLLYFLFNIRSKLTFLFFVVLALSLFQVSQMDEFDFFFERFAVQDGRFVGDNRSNQIENFMAIVDSDILLFGDYKCHELPEKMCISHGDISSSPVSPVYYGGVVQLLVQIFTHGFLILIFLKFIKYRFVSLALTLLLLQRPYFSSFGYQLMIYIPIFLMISNAVRQNRLSLDN
jgi:hypothetical protein